MSYWLAKAGKEISAQPQIGDVCNHCNNVVLSALDNYVCTLYDRYMLPIIERHERINFEYDYHLLKRWLLKLCFNSARIHKSVDLQALEDLLPYILGKDERVGRSVQIFLQLSYPQEIPKEYQTSELPSHQPLILTPDSNRVGYFYFVAHGEGKKLLRSVFLRSYTFFLAFWPHGGSVAKQNHFSEVIQRRFSGTVLLRKNQPIVDLECDGLGAWDSWKNSRQDPKDAFVFKKRR